MKLTGGVEVRVEVVERFFPVLPAGAVRSSGHGLLPLTKLVFGWIILVSGGYGQLVFR